MYRMIDNALPIIPVATRHSTGHAYTIFNRAGL
jgi:hypothetical protein